MSAWLLTLLTGYLLPLAAVFALRLGSAPGDTISLVLGLTLFTGYQLALAAFCFRRVLAELENRSFVGGAE